MADFTLWVEAAAPALGWQPGEFLTAYRRNRARAVMTELEASPVARALLAFMADQPPADLLMGELLDGLTDIMTAGKTQDPPSGWPKSPQALGGALRRLAPALRAHGIELTFLPYTKQGAPIALRQHGQPQLNPQDGSRDVTFREGPGEEVGEEGEEPPKSSSPLKPATSAYREKGEEGGELFFENSREEKNIGEGDTERKNGKSSPLSSPSSNAAMGAAFQGEELKTTSSPSSPTSSPNGTGRQSRGKYGQGWPYPRPRR